MEKGKKMFARTVLPIVLTMALLSGCGAEGNTEAQNDESSVDIAVDIGEGLMGGYYSLTYADIRGQERSGNLLKAYDMDGMYLYLDTDAYGVYSDGYLEYPFSWADGSIALESGGSWAYTVQDGKILLDTGDDAVYTYEYYGSEAPSNEESGSTLYFVNCAVDLSNFSVSYIDAETLAVTVTYTIQDESYSGGTSNIDDIEFEAYQNGIELSVYDPEAEADASGEPADKENAEDSPDDEAADTADTTEDMDSSDEDAEIEAGAEGEAVDAETIDTNDVTEDVVQDGSVTFVYSLDSSDKTMEIVVIESDSGLAKSFVADLSYLITTAINPYEKEEELTVASDVPDNYVGDTEAEAESPDDADESTDEETEDGAAEPDASESEDATENTTDEGTSDEEDAEGVSEG